MITVEKACQRCHLAKPISDFSKHSRAKDGLQPWCRDCKREHYEATKGVVLEQCRQYREANREQRNAQKRTHHAANRERLNAVARQYRVDHAEAVKEDRIRRYRDGGRPSDMPWPDRPISYSTAHHRVKATYGAASNYPCVLCGEQAHAWSYDHSDPNPLMHQGVGLFANKPPVPYSPDPARYNPMCRSCHVKRDRWAA